MLSILPVPILSSGEGTISDGRGGGCRAGLCVHGASEKWVLPMKASILAAFYVHSASQDFSHHLWPSNIKKLSSNGGLKF